MVNDRHNVLKMREEIQTLKNKLSSEIKNLKKTREYYGTLWKWKYTGSQIHFQRKVQMNGRNKLKVGERNWRLGREFAINQ